MNPNRRFVYEILGMGLELEAVSPEDVLEHVTPEVLAHHLPVTLKAKLLQASLNAERMTPTLVIEAIGIEALVEHAPLPILWLCVRGAVARQLGAMPERSAGPGAFAAAATSGNGGSIGAGVGGDDLQLKPTKSARPTTTMRPPSRISALSPRSRIATTGRSREETGPPVGTGGAPVDAGEIRVDDEVSRDFEIVEETDIARSRGSVSPNDEDTRHGPKS